MTYQSKTIIILCFPETFLCYNLPRGCQRDDIIKLFADELITNKHGIQDLDTNKNESRQQGMKSLADVINDAFESRKEQLLNHDTFNLNQGNDDGHHDDGHEQDSSFGFTLIDCLIKKHLLTCTPEKEQKMLPQQQKMLQKRMDQSTKEKDLLSKQAILNEISGLIVSGVEPVSKTLTWITLHLANQPELAQKMRMEIDGEVQKMMEKDGLRSKNNEKDFWKSIKRDAKIKIIDKTSSLIDCLITEVMRNHPPIEYLRRKVVSDVTMITDSMTTCTIPNGVDAIICLNPVEDCNQDVNGTDYNLNMIENMKFQTLKKVSVSSKRYKQRGISFGSGIRSCLGEQFALQLLKILTIELVQNYSFDIDCKRDNEKDVRLRRDNNQTASMEQISKSKRSFSDSKSFAKLSDFHSFDLVIKRYNR